MEKVKSVIRKIENLKKDNPFLDEYNCIGNFWKIMNFPIIELEHSNQYTDIVSGNTKQNALKVKQVLKVLKQYNTNKQYINYEDVNYILTDLKVSGTNLYFIFTHKIDLK